MANATLGMDMAKLAWIPYKPKVVPVHGIQDLENFRDQANATGHGLGWPQWRYSVEIGGAQWKKLLDEQILPARKVKEILDQIRNYPRVKTEPGIQSTSSRRQQGVVENDEAENKQPIYPRTQQRTYPQYPTR